MKDPNSNQTIPSATTEPVSRKPIQRWSAARKRDVVLRLLRGESIETVSRQLAVESYRLEQWYERALAAVPPQNLIRHCHATMVPSMKRPKRGVRMAWRWLRAIRRRVREHVDLAVECAALRHQVAIPQRSRSRHPRFGPWDRLLWAVLFQYWPRMAQTLSLLKTPSAPPDRHGGGARG
jgi:hypothetical protein